MIDPNQLRDLREAIEDVLEDCHTPECVALSRSLEDALLAIADYRKASRLALHARINIQLEHTQ